jgi:hypothetical protein
MSLLKLNGRLTDLQEKKTRLKEKIDTCKVRMAALKGARVDALAEGAATGAIDSELRGIDVDATECKETISAIDAAIIKVKAQIAEEKARLRAEKLAEFDKLIVGAITALLRDCPKVDTAISKLVDAAHERFYAPGFLHNLDRKIPGFDQLPRFIEREFRLQMNEKLNAIMAGALQAPVDDFKDGAPEEPEISKKDKLQHELAEAKRQLPGLVETHNHASYDTTHGSSEDRQVAERRCITAQTATDACYEEIRRLEAELAALGREAN